MRRDRRHNEKDKKVPKVKKQPVTQADFYEDGTFAEEQAERWLLSDVRKCLRFYVDAFQLYQTGLTVGTEATERSAYDISYNEARLLLQIHTDYMANDGSINLLQFVKLDDIPGIESILRPLPEIVGEMETVRQKFLGSSDIDMWDLEYNILTSYLSLVESNDTYTLYGANLLMVIDKFVELSQYLVRKQIDELEKWDLAAGAGAPDESDNLVRDMLDEQAAASSGNLNGDGSGVVTNAANASDNDRSEMMNVSDQITKESLTELLLDCYKFAQVLLEIIVQRKSGANESNDNTESLNVVQLNYLADTADKVYNTTDDIIRTVSSTIPLDLSDITLAKFGIEGARILLQGDLPSLDTWIATEIPSDIPPTDQIAYNMVKVDALDFTLGNMPASSDTSVEWALSSALAKRCNEVGGQLSAIRNDILVNGKFDQEKAKQQSHTVFQLCSIYVTSADNDLRRFVIKQREGEGASKTAEILFKNAKTILKNIQTISSKSCGMQETIVEKLKRNYIYQQAAARLELIDVAESSRKLNAEDHKLPMFNDAAIQDLLSDHPFYSQLR